MEALHGEHPGERLGAATGFGSLAIADPGVRFLVKRGYRLEQIERVSRLDLPVGTASLSRMREEAERHAGDYRFESWLGSTPDQRLEDLALLRRRMSTDAPSAGLAWEEEDWDAARIREHDERMGASSRRRTTTVAVHADSGRVVGFTELSIPVDAGRPLEQNDTLVLTEHRGHRLGLLLKLTNLEYAAGLFPGHPMVTTFNAEENRPMLDVNESMGFRPIAQAAGWRLDRVAGGPQA